MAKYKNIDVPDDYEKNVLKIGYPVHINFIELSKLYMNHVEWHWHQDLEVIIINHGDALFMTNDESIPLTAGEGIIVNANVMHCIVSKEKAPHCSFYSMTFHPSFLFGYGAMSLADKYLSPILSSKSFQYLALRGEAAKENDLLECVNEIIASNLIKKFGYELYTKEKLCSFWLTLMEIVAPHIESEKLLSSKSLDETRSKEMITYMEEHYSEKITLDDLADCVHISKSECCRCFKRALNLTPFEYLMKYRIFTAMNLLQSNDPVAESFSSLAFHVGFNNASYFNKVFKQYMECTPSEYKKKMTSSVSFNPFEDPK